MKRAVLIISIAIVILAGLWMLRSSQIEESKKRLSEKINLTMEGESTICAKRIDDYSWKDYAIKGDGFGEPTYGPTLVLLSFKKVSDDEFLFKRTLVRSTKKLSSAVAASELRALEKTAQKEMPQCENRNDNLTFLGTLGKHEGAIISNKYWLLTNVNNTDYGVGNPVVNYKGSLGSISSQGKTEAMVSTDNVIYKLVKREKSYDTYLIDIFSGDKPF